MTDYYAFYLNMIKYSEEMAKAPGGGVIMITDAEVRAAYKQYLLTYMGAAVACGLSMNAVHPDSQVCSKAKQVSLSLVNSLGW